METRYLVIILGFVIGVSVFVGTILMLPNSGSGVYFEDPFRDEHYEIEIAGMKDVYLVGQRYDFSYIISGYGNTCGGTKVLFPDKNGDTKGIAYHVDCVAGTPKRDFVWDVQKEQGKTFGHVSIIKPGRYTVGVEFERSDNFEPTQSGHTFHVVEKICDQINPESKALCLEDAFNSCTSSYAEFANPTVEGDGIIITSIVESWNDCKLRVYADHSRDRYKSVEQTRSVCSDVSIGREAVIFDGCNNEAIPPLQFDKQYYLHKERCEDHGGYWNFEFASCLDFSDDYDCEEMGGKLEDRAYTGEQPDYSKKSDRFVCMFRK